MKRTVFTLMALLMALSMVACKRGDTGSSTDKVTLKIAWVVDNIDISQQAFYDTAVAYVNYLNKTRSDLNLEMGIFDGQATVEKQISDIETAVAMKYDAIILNAVDKDGITPIAQWAMGEGVPVLNWGGMGDVCTVNLIFGNEPKKGQFAAEWTKKYLQDHPNVVFYAGLQYGSPNHPQTRPRLDYLHDLEKEMPDRFHILVEASSDWSSDTSMRMVEDWLQLYKSRMNYICSASEEQMLGVIEALRGEQVLEKYILGCFNGEQTGVDLLKAGSIYFDVGVVPPMAAAYTIEYTIRMALEGLKGTFDESATCTVSVDQANVDQHQKMILVNYDQQKYFDSLLKPDYRVK